MHSALYIGRLRHRRLLPRPHEFDYSIYMTYIDLSELESVAQNLDLKMKICQKQVQIITPPGPLPWQTMDQIQMAANSF